MLATIKGLGLRGLFCSTAWLLPKWCEFQSMAPPEPLPSAYVRDGTPAKIVCAGLVLAFVVLVFRIATVW
ncbi:hypothetical protein [Bradyrhizobium sp.]|uniref:hypothetical protein n=1 Tax=Bradyrhizobium sp. TaxID=376 RepID=UPI002E02ED2A|nr:hypothetical protein [Bradyrhizobium sp.]